MQSADIWSYRAESGFGTETRDLAGYKVEATDGSIGKVDEATYDTGSSYRTRRSSTRPPTGRTTTATGSAATTAPAEPATPPCSGPPDRAAHRRPPAIVAGGEQVGAMTA